MILLKIFSFTEVTSSVLREICDLLAEKGSDHLFIKFEKDPNSNNIRYYSNTVKRYGKGIVISESFDEKIRDVRAG